MIAIQSGEHNNIGVSDPVENKGKSFLPALRNFLKIL